MWLIGLASDAQVEEKHVALRPGHLSCGILVPDPRLRHGVNSANKVRNAAYERREIEIGELSRPAQAFASVLRDATGDGVATWMRDYQIDKILRGDPPDSCGQPHQPPSNCSVSDPLHKLRMT
jgi:hypothetical protein